MGGKFYLRLNIIVRLIVNKYCEGKLKRILKREFKSMWNCLGVNLWNLNEWMERFIVIFWCMDVCFDVFGCFMVVGMGCVCWCLRMVCIFFLVNILWFVWCWFKCCMGVLLFFCGGSGIVMVVDWLLDGSFDELCMCFICVWFDVS